MQRDVEKFGISDKRGRRRTSTDPYDPEAGLKDPAVCETCKAVYRQKSWQFDAKALETLENDPKTQWVTCPACQKTSEHYPEGILTLTGDYVWAHEDEITNLLANEANRVMGRNPLERIIRTTREGDSLVIETTEQKLAEQLGRTLDRAHNGELKIDWSENPRAVRVYWERWN
ncbi:MAG TPA: BCAM0308 family protein [Desulfuromonadales bacterium]|nr:BCAM0308 family protein [Desulfuromonadales bacterium]